MGRGGAAGLALHSLCSGTWNTARRQLHVIKIHSVEVVVEATELAAIPPGKVCTLRRILRTTNLPIGNKLGTLICYPQGFTKICLILDITVHILNKVLKILFDSTFF